MGLAALATAIVGGGIGDDQPLSNILDKDRLGAGGTQFVSALSFKQLTRASRTQSGFSHWLGTFTEISPSDEQKMLMWNERSR